MNSRASILLALATAWALTSCAAPAATPPAGVDLAQTPALSLETVAPSPEPEPSEPGVEASKDGPAPELEWLQWVVSHCALERLPRSKYTRGWLEWTAGDLSFLPPHTPRPALEPTALPAPGSEAARTLAEEVKRQWLSTPRSRVVDCAFDVPKRHCPGCRARHGAKRTQHYTALLPAALFERPEQVRSILLLLPGGNGGRARWFLTPIPGKGMRDAMSGGLEVKRHVDTWASEHPTASVPIVVALETNGWGTPNGASQYITHDAPAHIASRYLGIGLDKVTVGAEGISSGSIAIWQAMRGDPRAFKTVGLMCLYCADDDVGVHPWRSWTSKHKRVRAWLGQLQQARQEGDLHIRFSIGNLDKGWECNKVFHDAFTEAGIFADTGPTFSNCRKGGGENTQDCNVTWDGFHLYRDVGHTYALLMPAWPPQLRWHLDRLSEMKAR